MKKNKQNLFEWNKTIQDMLDNGLATVFQEPEYSLNKLQEYKEKYNITDEDMEDILYNAGIIYECK